MATPKIIPYTVKLRSVVPEKTFSKPPVVYTNDLRSAEFQFKITDMDASELLTATAKTMLYMRDGSFFQNPSTDVSRVGNVFSYLLKENEGNHAGIAKIQLVVYFNEGLANEQNFPTQLYEFEIINGLETKVAQEVMIYDWTTLTRDARAYIDQFVADELLRDAEFDNAQFDRNTAFVASQDARTLAFGTEQTNRGTAFTEEQNERTTAFNESESGRTTAENGRVTAESNRVTAESGRATKEGQRVTAENNRVTAESGRVTAESGRATAESGRVTTFAGYNARITGMETDVNVNATNLVTNGDFSNGTTGWIGAYTSSVTASGNEAVVVATATTSESRIVTTGSVPPGFKYYTRAKVKVNDATVCQAVKIRMDSTTVSIDNPVANVYYNISGIFAPSNISAIQILRMVTNTVPNQILYVKEVLAINLTTTFGAGNEPTAAQMDRLLTQFPNSWFNGTENLFLAKWALNELRRLDNDKANKAQEAWIAPTLLNGWVEVDASKAPRYMKDTLGFVHLKGRVKSGSNSSTIFTLPSGYRLDRYGAFPVDADGTFGKINVSPTGDVTYISGSNTAVSLENITFKAD